MQRRAGDVGGLRIGEVARRVGLSEHVLRAWERRYQIVQPTRTRSGYRIYSVLDEQRIRQMRGLVARGMPPGEAARAVLAGGPAVGTDRRDPASARQAAASRRRLRTALLSMAEPSAQTELDEVLANLPLEVAIRRVFLPVLRDIGDGWQRGLVDVAQEHFATAIIRGRLAGLARGWGEASGRRTLLACPPGERHDLALQLLGLLLARRGWSVSFLGAETPIGAVAAAAATQRTDVVVLSATDLARLSAIAGEVRELGTQVRVALAGPGATEQAAVAAGAELLVGDPVDAADALTTRFPAR